MGSFTKSQVKKYIKIVASPNYYSYLYVLLNLKVILYAKTRNDYLSFM